VGYVQRRRLDEEWKCDCCDGCRRRLRRQHGDRLDEDTSTGTHTLEQTVAGLHDNITVRLSIYVDPMDAAVAA
jgi:hypothetical protein